MKEHKKTIELNTGDIIYYAKNYFVLGHEGKKINCLPINMSLKKSNKKVNSTLFEKIDYTKRVVLDIDVANVHYLMSLNKEYTNCVLETYKLYQQRQHVVKRGAVVLVRGQLHYIYSEEGQDFVAFKLQNKYSDNLETIVVNGKTYYIYFDKLIRINKNESFDIKNLASEEEMITIKKLKRSCFEKDDINNSTKVCNLKVNKENLKPGSVFKIKHTEDSLVVIKVEGHLVTYINETYLDIMMNFRSNTDLESIEVILDSSKETLEKNKEKIKTLMDTYR